MPKKTTTTGLYSAKERYIIDAALMVVKRPPSSFAVGLDKQRKNPKASVQSRKSLREYEILGKNLTTQDSWIKVLMWRIQEVDDLSLCLIRLARCLGSELVLIEKILQVEFERCFSRKSRKVLVDGLAREVIDLYIEEQREFLDTFKDTIKDIVTEDRSFDLDNVHGTVDLILENRKHLALAAGRILDLIYADSTTIKMPFGIRILSSLIHQQCEKVGFDSRELVGTFIMQHVFLPVILAPELLGLPVPKDRKNLTMLSKLLLKLGTGKLFEDTSDESHYLALNDFLSEHEDRYTKFLQELRPHPSIAKVEFLKINKNIERNIQKKEISRAYLTHEVDSIMDLVNKQRQQIKIDFGLDDEGMMEIQRGETVPVLSKQFGEMIAKKPPPLPKKKKIPVPSPYARNKDIEDLTKKNQELSERYEQAQQKIEKLSIHNQQLEEVSSEFQSQIQQLESLLTDATQIEKENAELKVELTNIELIHEKRMNQTERSFEEKLRLVEESHKKMIQSIEEKAKKDLAEAVNIVELEQKEIKEKSEHDELLIKQLKDQNQSLQDQIQQMVIDMQKNEKLAQNSIKEKSLQELIAKKEKLMENLLTKEATLKEKQTLLEKEKKFLSMARSEVEEDSREQNEKANALKKNEKEYLQRLKLLTQKEQEVFLKGKKLKELEIKLKNSKTQLENAASPPNDETLENSKGQLEMQSQKEMLHTNAETDELRRKVSQLQEEVNLLRDQERENQQLQQRISQLQDELNAANQLKNNQTLVDRSVETASITSFTSEDGNHIKDYKSQLQQIETALEYQLKGIESEHTDSTNRFLQVIASQKAEISFLNNINEQNKDIIRKLEEKIDVFSEKQSEVHSEEFVSLETQVTALKSENLEIVKEKSNLETKLSHLQEENIILKSKMQEQRENYEDQIHILNHTSELFDKLNDSDPSEHATLLKEIQTLQFQQKKEEARLKELEDQTKSRQRETILLLEELECKQNDLNQREEHIKQEYLHLEHERNRLNEFEMPENEDLLLEYQKKVQSLEKINRLIGEAKLDYQEIKKDIQDLLKYRRHTFETEYKKKSGISPPQGVRHKSPTQSIQSRRGIVSPRKYRSPSDATSQYNGEKITPQKTIPSQDHYSISPRSLSPPGRTKRTPPSIRRAQSPLRKSPYNPMIAQPVNLLDGLRGLSPKRIRNSPNTHIDRLLQKYYIQKNKFKELQRKSTPETPKKRYSRSSPSSEMSKDLDTINRVIERITNSPNQNDISLFMQELPEEQAREMISTYFRKKR